MKVEYALRLLPSVEAVTPLRALLLANAEPAPRAQWGSARDYLTVGKHDISLGRLRRQLPPAQRSVANHLNELYTAFVDALECIDRGDQASAVGRFLDAGRGEEQLGRPAQARAWYAVALGVAETLQDHQPEIDTLLAIGTLCTFLGFYDEAARHHQRALALADAAFAPAGAISACEGLGAVSVELGEWPGAQAWYGRALHVAESAADATRVATVHHATGEFLRRKGDFDGASVELTLAHDAFEAVGDSLELARVLCTQGLVAADLSLPERAAGAFREALAWLRTGPANPGLEVFIRLHFARLHAEQGRFLQAEDEIRRAEELAIRSNRVRRLVQLYALLGTVRGQQRDEAGFVFFEQAIQLARTMERSPILEAQVYRDYGVFMGRLGRTEEARAYLTSAHELFASLGAGADVRQVEGAMAALPV